MARVRVLHWKESEAQPLLRALRSAKHRVEYDETFQGSVVTSIRNSKAEAIVIDLSRMPSHGRDVAVYLRGAKATRNLPLVFVGGEPEKVAKIRALLPDAFYTTLESVAAALDQALAHPPANPVVPPQMMERTVGRTTAQKLGIVEGSRVGLIDPPADYVRVLGKLPEGVALEEDAGEALPVTLWFIREPEEYVRGLPEKRKLAALSRFWVVWPKGRREGITPTLIRRTALSLGLVDYKICSVDEVWTAMVFALKKAR